MKYNKTVSSSRSKARKAYFSAPSSIRRKLMTAPLSKALRSEYNVRSIPIRKDDEVLITRGKYKQTQGKVTCVYRKRRYIRISGVSRDRNNGFPVDVGIDASNVVIVKPYLDPCRRDLLARKSRSKADKSKGKVTKATTELD